MDAKSSLINGYQCHPARDGIQRVNVLAFRGETYIDVQKEVM